MTNDRVDVRRLLDHGNDLLAMPFRKVHDSFGWGAKESLGELGRCSGTLYRTERFMTLPHGDRCGRKKGQNVHIEHTVPIAELERRWIVDRRAYISGVTVAEMHAWMLMHSVTTAFHWGEERGMVGYSSKTEAFNPRSPWFGKPFMRYVTKKESPPIIWNVFDEEPIEIDKWTFGDHFNLLMRLVDEVEESQGRIAKVKIAEIQEAAAGMLECWEQGMPGHAC